VLLNLSFSTSIYALGEETIPAGEQADIDTSPNYVNNTMMEHAKVKDNSYHRGFHTKAHACSVATLKVNPDLPEIYKVGIFADSSPNEYKAWIRYSNGEPGLLNDNRSGPKGFAIKLLGVEGAKALPAEIEPDGQTQDFLLADDPTFQLKAAHDFTTTGVNNVNSLLAAPAFLVANTPQVNPLTKNYWSATPYSFGSGSAVKYKIEPCATNSTDGGFLNFNKLRSALYSALNTQEQCFNFLVQFQENATDQPIEDPTIEWTTEFHSLATIVIPQQGFNNNEQNEFCEKLAFNPWHSLEVHRPLGGINRLRKDVYKKASDKRRVANGFPIEEPSVTTTTDLEAFWDQAIAPIDPPSTSNCATAFAPLFIFSALGGFLRRRKVTKS
jgi:hypothetical protein